MNPLARRAAVAVWVLGFAAMVSFMGIGLVDPILKPIAENLELAEPGVPDVHRDLS